MNVVGVVRENACILYTTCYIYTPYYYMLYIYIIYTYNIYIRLLPYYIGIATI